MYCDNCGRNIRDGSEFCPFCGEKVQKAVKQKEVCAICGSEIVDNACVDWQIDGKTGSYSVPVCNICDTNYNTLFTAKNGHELKDSFYYIDSCKENIQDACLKQYLTDAIQKNYARIVKIEHEAERRAQQYNTQPIYDALQDDGESDSRGAAASNGSTGLNTTGWIVGMRVISWIMFIAVIIVGFAFANDITDGFRSEGRLGILIILGSVIVGFWAVAATMIFLDMAKDIHEIRNNLRKKK